MSNTPKSSYVFSPQIKNKIEALRQLAEYETEAKQTATSILINLINKEYKARKEELEEAGIKTERVTNNK